jgi:ribonuclease PH
MKRSDGRREDEMRKVRIRRGYLRHAEGSVLIEAGHTRVVCSATVEERVPSFRRDSGGGWVTAEYGMLPRSSDVRIRREVGARGVKGRTQEIQRLIGRSLRAITDLSLLGPRSVLIDCDVLQADGGTRTLSVTGAYVALAEALRFLEAQGVLGSWPLRDSVAAVSVGLVGKTALLDLTYEEDFGADVDLNVVMTGAGRFVEVQGTAEGAPFAESSLQKMLRLARKGVGELAQIQAESLEGRKRP